MADALTFEFNTYVLRGKYEREVDVAGEYRFDPETGAAEIINAYVIDDYPLTTAEAEEIDEYVNDIAADEYAAWLSDQDCEDAMQVAA